MNFSTILCRSSSTLLLHLSKLTAAPNSVMLFALSSNAANLEEIVSRLRHLTPTTIGCLSAPFPGNSESVVCATAMFPSDRCVPFRSEIPGRPPIQVGRWNRKTSFESNLPDITQNTPDWGNLWESGTSPRAPAELLGQRDIESLVFFSDDAPEGFVRSLGQFEKADKLGIITSSTPFITGRPFTLFHNDRIYSSGAVGLALKHQPRRTFATSFHGLIPLSARIKVSKSEGNLIHELNHSNPSKMLIDAIASDFRPRIAGKDRDLLLGHFYSDPPATDELQKIYRILSGDPSRGSIALDTESAPAEDEDVQFFSRAPHSALMGLKSLKASSTENGDSPSIRFLCSSADDGFPNDKHQVTDQLFPGMFLAASENGFLSTNPFSKCTVPGTIDSLTWARA